MRISTINEMAKINAFLAIPVRRQDRKWTIWASEDAIRSLRGSMEVCKSQAVRPQKNLAVLFAGLDVAQETGAPSLFVFKSRPSNSSQTLPVIQKLF